MVDFAHNQVGQQTLIVTGAAVGLTFPVNALGVALQPRHALIQNLSSQAVRWRSDGVAASPIAGQIIPGLLGQSVPVQSYSLNFMDAMSDFRGVLMKASFIRDAASTGNATLEIAYFS